MSKRSRRGRQRKDIQKREGNSITRHSSLTEISEHYSGPIPPPDILAKYNDVMPGLADKLVDQFIAQGAHRMGIESKVVAADIQRSRWGLVAGFTLSLLIIGGGYYLIYLENSAEGIAVMASTVVMLVGTFVYATERRRSERKDKAAKN